MARISICKINYEETVCSISNGKYIEKICDFNRMECINAIKSSEYAYFKNGIFSTYKKKPTETVVMLIGKSYYGAEVEKDDETGDFYVSVPFFT